MYRSWITLILGLTITLSVLGQNPPSAIVDVNFDVKHKLGDISTFDRSKFISIHSDQTETDWDGNNFTPDLRNHFLNGYDVYMGRSTGGITWVLKNQAIEDSSRPGFVSVPNMQALGLNSRNNYASKTWVHPYEARTNLVLAAQFHPFWPDGTKTNKGWALSEADTPEEPFGTATGEYMGQYIKNFFGGQGKPHPPYVEVINEPLWELVTNGTTPPSKVFDFHNNVATAIRNIYPDVLIGGYTAAFPDFDVRNFDRWHERDKLFIDMSGDHMDFIAIHLYDFPAIGGKQRYRKGSNVEATFDMMEHYSMLSLGEVLPFEISEYSAQVHDLDNQPWSPYRDWLRLKSNNSILMSFMERADNMLMTIPFTVVKAEWGRHDGIPYGPRLMRQAFEAEGEAGNQWVYTELVKFYQLWADVRGTRVDAKSTDPDLLTQAFVEGNVAHVVVNNLEFNPRDIGLAPMVLENNPLQEVTVKHLYLAGQNPILDTTVYTELPPSLVLGSEATMILKFQYENPVAIADSSEEVKHYADAYLKEISSGTTESFQINAISKGNWGEAILRVGIGRDHGLSLTPELIFNDSVIPVPVDFRGGPQTQRDNFFGVIEIPIPYSLIEESNTIDITFPDNGGHISSVAMQTYAFSRQISRSETPTQFNTSFTVSDATSGEPIAGAEVILNVDTAYTDVSGFTQFDTIQVGIYPLKIQAEGYNTYMQQEFSLVDNTHLLIKLQPMRYQAQFNVIEKDLQIPVYNATITSGARKANTNSEGDVTLEFFSGSYNYSVEKAYFESYADELVVAKDTSIQIELTRLLADAKFRVWSNDGGSREAYATVSVGDQSQETNTLGMTTFQALKVDTLFTYTVAKDGFALFSDQIILKKDSTVEVSLLVGINNRANPNLNLSIFPNPAKSSIQISWQMDVSENVILTMTDLSGRKVWSKTIESIPGENVLKVDISDLETGIYLLQIEGSQWTHTERVSKN